MEETKIARDLMSYVMRDLQFLRIFRNDRIRGKNKERFQIYANVEAV